MDTIKYKVEIPSKLKSWEYIAKVEIYKWLNIDAYQKNITANTMKYEDLGPFTKFLYHFASICECRWGVMVDFDERKQRIYLTDKYYKWMHKLRDELINDEEAKNIESI